MVKPARAATGRLDSWLVLGILGLTVFNALGAKVGLDESSSSINEIVWSTAYVVAAVRLSARKRELRVLLSGSAPMLVFIGLCFVSTLWSVGPGTTLKNAIELAGTGIVACYVVASLRLLEFLKILAFFLGASSVASLALIFVAPGRGRMNWGGGPWDGIFEEKNALGAAMAIAIIVYLILLLRPNARRKIVYAAALALSVILLVGSDSATAILDCGAVIAIGAFAFACVAPGFRGVPRIVVILAAAMIVVGTTIAGFNPDAVYAFFGRSQTLTGRTDFWPYLLDAVSARPILGYGYSAFFTSPIAEDYLSYYVVEAGGWTPYHAHNSFLQALLDTGYTGLAVLVIFILAGLVRAIRFLAQERNVVSLWPLLVISFLVLGSYTETYLGSFNTLSTILFFSAFLYPLRDRFGSQDQIRNRRAPARAVSVPRL